MRQAIGLVSALRYACWALVAANVAMGVALMVFDGSGGPDAAGQSVDVPMIELLDEVTRAWPDTAGSAVSGIALRFARESFARESFARENCRTSAPFADFRDAMAFASRVEALGARTQVREAIARGRPDHVVYVEPAASRDAARRILRELEGQSIGGQVVDEGALANAVTVGVFAERAAADALVARVRAFGYPVRRRALDRAHTVYTVHSGGDSGLAAQGRPGRCGATLRVDRVTEAALVSDNGGP